MLEQKDIDQIKLEAGGRDIHELAISDGDDVFSVIVVAPSRVEWMKLLEELNASPDVGRKMIAHESFLLAAAKYPPRDEIKRFIDKKFAVLTEITDQIGQLIGAGAKVRAKKL